MKHTKILSRCFLIFMMSLFFGHVFPSDISSEMTDPVASESEEGLKRLSGETDSEFTSRVAQDAAVNVSRAMDEKLAAIVARDGLGEAATENKMQAAHALVSATEENVGRLQNISDKSFNLVADNATEYASKSPVEQASEKLTAINKGETAAGATRDATDEVAKKLKKFAKKLAKVLTKKGQGAESQAVKKEAEVALNEFTAATRKLGDADCEAMAEQAAATGRKMINQIDESFAKDANSLLSVVKDATGKELDQTMADKICDDAASTIKMDADRATNKIFSKLDNQAENALKDLNTVDKYKAKWGSKSLASDSARFGRYMKKPFVGVADSVGSVTARGVGKGVSGALWHVGSTLFQAVLFMVPSIFQSSMLAQKQRQVELETLAQPLKFGDWVLQIPDSCINMNTPTSSFPIYVRIPVDFVGNAVPTAISIA